MRSPLRSSAARRAVARVGVVGVAAVSLVIPALAGVSSVGVRPLPPDREATVVAWQAKSKSAVVALKSGHLMTVHGVRKQKPGTRVRVQGIKWGTPSAGIKWSKAPKGIKWGIKWARNGTFQSTLQILKKAAAPKAKPKARPKVRVRGVVVKRYRGAVAIGTKGGVVVVRQAVWLPKKGKKTKSLHATRPAVGDLVTTNAEIVGPEGRLYGDGVRVIAVAQPVPVPMGGKLLKSSNKNTIRISADIDPAYSVVTTMKVPGGVDVSSIKPGTEVAATATINPDKTLRMAELSPNTSFAAANNPNAQIVAPPPAPAASVALIAEALSDWQSAVAAGQVTDAGVAASGRDLLQQAHTAASDGRIDAATTALDQFLTLLETRAATIGPVARARAISLVSVIKLA